MRIIEVGQTAELKVKITDELIRKFSEISGDRNPIHLDDDYASKTIFKKRIAHGLLVSSFFSTLLANELPGEGTIYLGQEIQFLAPVYVNDEVIVSVRVSEIDGRKVALETRVKKGEELLVDGTARVSLPKRA